MYSYVTVLTDDSYVYGVMILAYTLKQTKSKYPLHVLITEDVSGATKEILNQLNITYQLVDKIPIPQNIYNHNFQIDPRIAATWINCLTKLKAFDLTQFEKIVFLDADLLLLKNIDHLFNYPHLTAAIDGEYFHIWKEEYLHFNNGCIVIEPSHELFLNILNFIKNLKEKDIDNEIIADQEIINYFYKDWPKQTNLHLNKYYNIFAPYIQENDLEDIQKNAYFIHFIGRKPWDFFIKATTDTYVEYFYELGMKIMKEVEDTLDYNKITSKLVLTVYAICKDEIKNVDKWLKSFNEADYMCILDTGSTDGTWEFLQAQTKKYPNLIIDQQIITPWRFDTARNKNLAMIPKETTIYFMADLDELVKEQGWSKLIKNCWRPNFHRAEYDYNRDVLDNDTVERSFKEYRIHGKKWVKYINVVHEALCDLQGEKHFYIESCTPVPITVWHYPEPQKNRRYYLDLCEEALKENPDDGLMRLQLILEYEIIDDKDKILEHAFSVIKNSNINLQPIEIARAYTSIGRVYAQRDNISAALWFFTQGRLIAPMFFDNYIEPAYIYFNLEDFNSAIEILKCALAKCQGAYHCNLYDIKSYIPYYLIGLSYLNMGQLLEGMSYLEIAYYLNNDPEIRKILNDIINETMQKRFEIFQ